MQHQVPGKHSTPLPKLGCVSFELLRSEARVLIGWLGFALGLVFLGGGVVGVATHATCGILVPQPGSETSPPSVEAQSLNHWTAKEVPSFLHKAEWYYVVRIHYNLFILHQPMDIWIASTFWLLLITLQWIWLCKYLFKTLFQLLWMYAQMWNCCIIW